MATVKSTDALHAELRDAIQAHVDRLAEINHLLEAGDEAAFLRMIDDARAHSEALASILADTLQTLGGLAVRVGREEFAMGEGVSFDAS